MGFSRQTRAESRRHRPETLGTGG